MNAAHRLGLTLALLAGALPVAAQSTALEIDPAQTKVAFTVNATLHTVHGTFILKRGNIRFDPAGGKAEGELIVDASSGKTGNDSRDAKMNKEVLESAKFPDIVFRPDRVDGKVAPQGTSQVQLHGVFDIHGSQHDVTAPVEVAAANGQFKATVHFTVPYVQWGMKNPSNFMLHISDKLEMTVETVARLKN